RTAVPRPPRGPGGGHRLLPRGRGLQRLALARGLEARSLYGRRLRLRSRSLRSVGLVGARAARRRRPGRKRAQDARPRMLFLVAGPGEDGGARRGGARLLAGSRQRPVSLFASRRFPRRNKPGGASERRA